jgi:hypothetical protein
MQKKKDIEDEKKLYPTFKPNANLLPSSKMAPFSKTTSPLAPPPDPSEDRDTLLVTSGTSKSSRVAKKTRHRANTIDPKADDQSNQKT